MVSNVHGKVKYVSHPNVKIIIKLTNNIVIVKLKILPVQHLEQVVLIWVYAHHMNPLKFVKQQIQLKHLLDVLGVVEYADKESAKTESFQLMQNVIHS
jgi:hypothetical protein